MTAIYSSEVSISMSRRVIGNGGGGGRKPVLLKEQMKQAWNFQRGGGGGGGFKPKKRFYGEGMDIFWTDKIRTWVDISH